LIFVIGVGVLPAFAQDNSNKDKKEKQQPKKKKSESNEKVYQRWMDEDVRWIITDEERKAFKTLKTDEERETFIEQFWARRDPDPDTPENEYREEYAARIAYANAHFASGIPGWKTDRGRIYIMFGPPDSKETHPAGGQYQRPTNEGGGSTSTFPFEIWFYRHLDNVGDGLEIEFVDPTMSGEYHIARSPDEKDALLTVPGAGLTLSEELGLSSKTDRVAFGGMGSSREMTISAIAEPAMMLAIFTVAITAGSTDLSQMVQTTQGSTWKLLDPTHAMAFAALFIVLLAETGRIPVDNPATHLELTMIHEAIQPWIRSAGSPCLLVSEALLHTAGHAS